MDVINLLLLCLLAFGCECASNATNVTSSSSRVERKLVSSVVSWSGGSQSPWIPVLSHPTLTVSRRMSRIVQQPTDRQEVFLTSSSGPLPSFYQQQHMTSPSTLQYGHKSSYSYGSQPLASHSHSYSTGGSQGTPSSRHSSPTITLPFNTARVVSGSYSYGPSTVVHQSRVVYPEVSGGHHFTNQPSMLVTRQQRTFFNNHPVGHRSTSAEGSGFVKGSSESVSVEHSTNSPSQQKQESSSSESNFQQLDNSRQLHRVQPSQQYKVEQNFQQIQHKQEMKIPITTQKHNSEQNSRQLHVQSPQQYKLEQNFQQLQRTEHVQSPTVRQNFNSEQNFQQIDHLRQFPNEPPVHKFNMDNDEHFQTPISQQQFTAEKAFQQVDNLRQLHLQPTHHQINVEQNFQQIDDNLRQSHEEQPPAQQPQEFEVGGSFAGHRITHNFHQQAVEDDDSSPPLTTTTFTQFEHQPLNVQNQHVATHQTFSSGHFERPLMIDNFIGRQNPNEQLPVDHQIQFNFNPPPINNFQQQLDHNHQQQQTDFGFRQQSIDHSSTHQQPIDHFAQQQQAENNQFQFSSSQTSLPVTFQHSSSNRQLEGDCIDDDNGHQQTGSEVLQESNNRQTSSHVFILPSTTNDMPEVVEDGHGSSRLEHIVSNGESLFRGNFASKHKKDEFGRPIAAESSFSVKKPFQHIKMHTGQAGFKAGTLYSRLFPGQLH